MSNHHNGQDHLKGDHFQETVYEFTRSTGSQVMRKVKLGAASLINSQRERKQNGHSRYERFQYKFPVLPIRWAHFQMCRGAPEQSLSIYPLSCL